MRIAGYDYEATSEAKSKKDAQTASAWLYADYLVQHGKIVAADLPPRAALTQMETDNPGGWTVDTARQRLNRFCTHYGLACNITNEVQPFGFKKKLPTPYSDRIFKECPFITMCLQRLTLTFRITVC